MVALSHHNQGDLAACDLGYIGNPFTWCNRKRGRENIRETSHVVLVNVN